MPPLATTERGWGRPVNQWTVSIWWTQPLVGDAGGVGPEEAELKILARVELVLDDSEAVAVPVGVFLLERGHDGWTAPAAGLVDVPAHLDHDDVAELAGLDVLASLDVGGRGAALGADGDDLLGAFDGLEEGARVGHGVRGGLFDVGVAAGLDRLDAVAGVLEVGGGDEDGVDVVAGVEGLVVDDGVDGIAGELLDVGRAIFAAHLPDVGDGDDLEVEFLGGGQEGGDVAAPHAVAAADDADADAVVGADDLVPA